MKSAISLAFVGWEISGSASFAHVGGAPHPHELTWSFEPWVVISLAAATLWYARGIAGLVREGAGRLVSAGSISAFAAGIASLVLALISPIDTVGAELFSVHMLQHMLLMMLAAPLLVVSKPGLVFLWAFSPEGRRRIGRIWTGAGLSRALRLLMHPVVVWTAFCGLFVFWHIPAAYQWALTNEGVHALEHLCFFVSSLAFWTLVFEPSGSRRLGYGAALMFVATTAVLSGLPGALMIFAPRPLYPAHAEGVARWGLTLIEDQQLAGLLMWIPAGFLYVAAIAWLFVRWLEDAERRVSISARQAAFVPCIMLGWLLLAGCDQNASGSDTGGNPARGADLIRYFGCGGCHTIPGIERADGVVGPPLTMMGRRIYIAGVLRNSPDNMTAWLQDPQQFVPGNAMPSMGISRDDARDLTAYLYTLR